MISVVVIRHFFCFYKENNVNKEVTKLQTNFLLKQVNKDICPFDPSQNPLYC